MAVDVTLETPEVPTTIGSQPLNVRLTVPKGTPPVDLVIDLIENETTVQTSGRIILNAGHIGKPLLFKSIFTVKTPGVHTVQVKVTVRNPWGEASRLSDPVTFEVQGSVIPIVLAEPWILYYDGRARDAEADVAVSDFVTRGWNIEGKVKCGERSEAADEWSFFDNDTRHAICIISYNQAPFYQDGPRFWGTLLNGSRYPGTIGSSYLDDRYIYGSGGAKYPANEYALVKYMTYKGRSVIVIFDDADHLYMAGDWHRTVWRRIAEWRSSVTYPWFIFDKNGKVVDHG